MFISLSRRKADSSAAVLPVVGARLRPQEDLDLQPKGSPALAPNHQQGTLRAYRSIFVFSFLFTCRICTAPSPRPGTKRDHTV